jgi:acetyl esterase/lipase
MFSGIKLTMPLTHYSVKMPFSLSRYLLLTTALSLSACVLSVADSRSAGTLPAVNAEELNNISYSSVLALPSANNSIKLAYGSDPLQFGQLYLPGNRATLQAKAPLLIFVHGGCWLNAYDIGHSNAFSQALATLGYAVWSLEYRRIGDAGGGWPGSLDDILRGIEFVHTSLSDYAIDTSRMVISGHSAGGQLALLAAGQNNSPAVVGVIGMAAITDMISYAKGGNGCQRATVQFIGGDYPVMPKRYQQASPQQQHMHQATLLLQGDNDNIVPLTQASQSGMPYQVIDNAGHFDWIHPQTTAYKQFVLALQELLPL